MSASSAVTINRPVEEVVAILDQADPPVFDADAEVSTTAAPGDQGTELRVRLENGTPGGAVGEKVVSMLGVITGNDPQRRLDDALRRLKQILETGEVLVSDAIPEGTDATAQRTQGPAQPPPASETDSPLQNQEV